MNGSGLSDGGAAGARARPPAASASTAAENAARTSGSTGGKQSPGLKPTLGVMEGAAVSMDASTDNARAASSTVAAKGPAQFSRLTPAAASAGSTEKLGFSPTTPQNDAGIRIDPPASDPSAIGATPSATLAAA